MTTKQMEPIENKTTKKSGLKGGMSTVAPIAAGAIAGAVLGGVAGVIASDEKKRKVVSNIGSTMADYATDAIDAVHETVSEAQDAIKDTAEKTLAATKKK